MANARGSVAPHVLEEKSSKEADGGPQLGEVVEMRGLVVSFRIENPLLQLFIKVAGLLPRARPEPIPLKGPLKGTLKRDCF